MKAFGYSVIGNKRALASVHQVKDIGCCINWEGLNTGDLYWAESGEGFRVEINHETKKVMFKEEDPANITYKELYGIE